MPLTDMSVRNAKPTDKPYKISDAGGLYLSVEKGGTKLWRQTYRFGGKQKLLSLGVYPHVGLAAARDANKRLLAAGVDPSEKRKADKHAAAIAHLTTFDASLTIGSMISAALAADWTRPKTSASGSPETIEKLDWVLSLVRLQLGLLTRSTE
jgi:hypothetical protein